MSINWICTVIGQFVATVIATNFFVNGFGYQFDKIIFGMGLTVISCGMNSFFLELKDKKEFLDIIKTDLMQSDLQKVLTVLPEGVLIFKRFRNPHIIYWNKQLESLLSFHTGGPEKFEVCYMGEKNKQSSIMS